MIVLIRTFTVTNDALEFLVLSKDGTISKWVSYIFAKNPTGALNQPVVTPDKRM